MTPMVRDMMVKAAGAAAFFFVLQTYLLDASPQTALMWAGAGAAGAAYLAWSQWNRF